MNIEKALPQLQARSRVLASRFGRPSDAEDKVQDTILNLIQAGYTDLPYEEFLKLAYKSLKNTWIDNYRKKREKNLPKDEEGNSGSYDIFSSNSPSPEDIVSCRETLDSVKQAINSLGENKFDSLQKSLLGLETNGNDRVYAMNARRVLKGWTKAFHQEEFLKAENEQEKKGFRKAKAFYRNT